MRNIRVADWAIAIVGTPARAKVESKNLRRFMRSPHLWSRFRQQPGLAQPFIEGDRAGLRDVERSVAGVQGDRRQQFE